VDDVLLTNSNLSEEWVRNALVFLPDHPLLHLALAGFEMDPKSADFLCSFGLARLPKNSVACTRAGEMLLRQHRPELALAAVDKALLADPTDLPAQATLGAHPGSCAPGGPIRAKSFASLVKTSRRLKENSSFGNTLPL